MSIGSAFNKTALCGRTAMAALVVGAGLMAAPGLAAAAPAAASATGDGSGSEVVVTATRREEKLSRVPVAVTAIGGVQAREQHIENFGDLPALVPGATFISTKGQSTATVEIRGQSVTNDAPALEVPVAIFMDDIYYGTLASFDADFFDAWLAANKDLKLVRDGLIFAHPKAADATAQAKEFADLKSGLEPLDPDKPATGLERVSA